MAKKSHQATCTQAKRPAAVEQPPKAAGFHTPLTVDPMSPDLVRLTSCANSPAP